MGDRTAGTGGAGVNYVGSGPYCYANSLSMMFGPGSPATAVIETLTGSPFGFELIGGHMPLFDPYGWDPEIGVDAAIELLGWTCERTHSGSAAEALARLRAAGPAMVGPVDMGTLLYQPNASDAAGADHYVVVLEADGDTITLHDPQGYPYATLATEPFIESWRAESIAYTDVPFVMRSGFVRQRTVSAADALRASLPKAAEWLAGKGDASPGTLGNAAGVERLTEQVETGLDPGMRGMMAWFSVRVGARRLNDAAACLAGIGLNEAAKIAADQARIVGGLQQPLVAGDDKALVDRLRELAPTYERLRAELSR
jgi:hypothetical protein